MYKSSAVELSLLLAFSMMTVQVFLGVSLFALLVVDIHGLPIRGLKSQDQRGSDTDGGGNFVYHPGTASGRYAPVSYSVSRDFSLPVKVVRQGSSLSQSLQADPAAASLGSAVPEAGYPVGTSLVPVPAGYANPPQIGAVRLSPSETKWSVNPKIFSEEGLSGTHSFESSDLSSLSPREPAPRSGETSNIVKDAEVGNFQHETEEIGYPVRTEPGQALASVLLPRFGAGVFWGYPSRHPYPEFDYRFLYGLYPPGTYSSFSKLHEKGKDYRQDAHYLKELDYESPDAPGSDQQKLFTDTF
ncbi:uncharacterized protein LOC108243025 [Kryptolebias marmoratus]|uniref:uncharacterized protein LOC108243025 n=1 Tax=Kryptolebias marmoratus TaxID=37003 RepID=UPI0007F897C2|nr:uncharacterized protein LOC108243025 [Kryptolebias marmoratus]